MASERATQTHRDPSRVAEAHRHRLQGALAGRPGDRDRRTANGGVQLDYAPLVQDDVFQAVECAAIEILEAVVSEFEVDFACISDDGDGHLHTGLDLATIGSPPSRRAREGDILTAYAWTTYVVRELLEQLGGSSAVRDTGAFWKVDELKNGAVLIATEHLQDFAGARVRAVKNALEPVLLGAPTGVSTRALVAHLRVAWDDGRNGPVGPRYGEPGNPLGGAGGGSRTPTP